MTPQQILNADLGTIARWCREGFAWWIDELAGLVPTGWRGGGRRQAPWTARVGRDGAIQLWRDGRPTQATPPSASAGWRADVMLPPEAVLVRDLDLPRLSAGDLRRLLVANMDRLTPFPVERIYFDAPVVDRANGDARLRLRLAVIPRDRARPILDQARAMGLEVERLGVETEDGHVAFDFMTAIRAEEGEGARDRQRTLWWSACVGLVGLNVAVAVLMDLSDVRRIEAAVEAEQPKAMAAARLRRTVEAGQQARLEVLALRSQNEPLRIVDALSKVLPDGQWAHRMEWNGRAVRVVGSKSQGFDVPAALRQTPALTNPRSLLSDMPVKTASGVEPFDVIADSATRAPK